MKTIRFIVALAALATAGACTGDALGPDSSNQCGVVGSPTCRTNTAGDL